MSNKELTLEDLLHVRGGAASSFKLITGTENDDWTIKCQEETEAKQAAEAAPLGPAIGG